MPSMPPTIRALWTRPRTISACGPTAPLFARIGFRPIPVDEIGLYPDPYRAAWPVKLHKNGGSGP